MRAFPPLVLILCLLSLSALSRAQTRKVDSLKSIYINAWTRGEKLQAILAVCEEHQSMNRDTLYQYALIAKELALQTNNNRGKSLAALALANAYMRWGWVDSALVAIEPQLLQSSADDANTRDLYFKLARLKAMCYGSKSNFKDALSILYQVVSKAEHYRDSLALGANLNTIGSVAIARNQPAEALNWLFKALAASANTERFYTNLSAIYINAANAYYLLQKTDSANYYINKSLPLCRKIENLNILATALRIQSNICIGTNRLAQAEAALQEMIAVRKKINDDASGIVDDNLLLVDFYTKTGQVQKGIDLCNQALSTGNIYEEGGATFTNNSNLRLLYYEALAKCYKTIGNSALYEQTLERIISAKDSLYQANSAQALAELQNSYEVQKIENTVIQQKLDLTRKNYMFLSALLLSLLVIIAAWLIFRSYRRRQQTKLQLMQEEEKRLAAEAVKEAEEAERKRIAADLHDNLGAYAASIVSNLDYIKLQPTANSSMALQELHNNSQSIVSELSDTIWALKKDALSLTAISDRLKVFIQRIQRSYLQITIDVFETISTDHLLTPSQAFHLFRILKEGVTNALRHSNGRNIQVIIEGEAQWRITIKDDGAGMQMHPVTKEGGNGLLNMRVRAQEAGWNINWQPAQPAGTQVVIEPTTN